MIDLNICKISRRGKGAKGTIEVKTFGIPVLDADGIAKDWSYEPFVGMDTAELITFLEPFGNVNVALLRGFDLENKSSAMKSQNEQSVLAGQILALDLADDVLEANNVAKTILQTRRNMIASGIDADDEMVSVEFWLEKRARLIDKQRKANNLSPRLIKKNVVVEDAISEDDTTDSND